MKIAVIGLGEWGKNHVRVLSELGSLGAVSDINEERLKLFAQRYGVNGYRSLEELLRNERLDGAVVATPTKTHFSITRALLEASIPTLVEKPMTATSLEAEELVRIAREAGTLLLVGFIERFNPAVRTLKEEVGRLGGVFLLEFHRENRMPALSKLDVGIILDTAVHDIDTARWIFNQEPQVVYSRTGRVMSDFEDFAVINLGFKGEATATIFANWVTPKRLRFCSAVCMDGIITLDFITQEVRIETKDETYIPRKPYQEPLLLELQHFIECIRGRCEPIVRAEDGLINTRIAEAASLSARMGIPIYLGPGEKR